MIVVYDSSFWHMRLCHKNIIRACYSLADVPTGPEDFYDRVGYIKMNNRIRQSYRVNGH